MKKLELELEKGTRKDAIEDIRKYFLLERDEEVSDFTAGLILDFILTKIGPYIYNQGISDAYAYMNERVEDLLGLEKHAR